MVPKALLFVSAILLFSFPIDARRRAVVVPDQSPASWLQRHAIPLQTDQFDPQITSDLDALVVMIGDAPLVGLGDGTHGTSEYFTVKHRIIERLVSQRGFALITFEAPWPEFRIINAYVRGDAIDLWTVNFGETYPFWKTEEMLAFFDWARQFNQAAGRQVVSIAGVDPWIHYSAAADVVALLQSVDPGAAASASAAYSCISQTAISQYSRASDQAKASCRAGIEGVREMLENREAELTAATSAHRFADVLWSAEMVRQAEEIWRIPTQGYGTARLTMRDLQMARNVATLSDDGAIRSVYWAHNEHAGQDHLEIYGDHALAQQTTSTGARLSEWFGDGYFVIGTCFDDGTYNTFNGTTATPYAMGPPLPENIETTLRLADLPRFIIPLRGTVPYWFSPPLRMRIGQTSPTPDPSIYNPFVLDLARKFDALIYLARTTPSRYVK